MLACRSPPMCLRPRNTTDESSCARNTPKHIVSSTAPARRWFPSDREEAAWFVEIVMRRNLFMERKSGVTAGSRMGGGADVIAGQLEAENAVPLLRARPKRRRLRAAA